MNSGETGTKSRAVRFHKLGLRTETRKYPNGKKVAVKSHRWEHWRETEPRPIMLHINNTQRAKIGRMIQAYFKYQFEPAYIVNE